MGTAMAQEKNEASGGGKQLLNLELFEDGTKLGTSRTKHADGRYLQEGSGFSITIRELYAAHGHWDIPEDNKADEGDNGKEDLASLIVLRIQLIDHDPSRKRRFKNVTMGIRFTSEVKGAAAMDDPYLAGFAPAKDGKIGFLPTSVLKSKSITGEVNFDIDTDPSPVVLGASLSKEKGWEWEREVLATMQAFAKQDPYNRLRHGDNYVEWIISENEYAKRIADTNDVAILLRRPSNASFKMHFKTVEASIDIPNSIKKSIHDAYESVKKFLHLYDPETKVPTSYIYDPTIQGDHPQKDTFSIDKLKVLEQGSLLDAYAFIRILGEARGVHLS